MLALEKVGSLFTGWMRSCLTCEDSQPAHTGVEREMKICHTQPHLVPPMKLVVYDDLPSPSIHQHRNSLSTWLNEGRNLASRASTRASLPMKRSSTMPLKISAPSDFRRVQSFQSPTAYEQHTLQSPTTKYEPLDLRIHRSGNRLSDLPSFDSFQLNESPQRMTLPAPPRALTTPTNVRDRRCQTTYSVSRKPVGSENRRSLGKSPVIEKPVRITSSLVPHFSTVTPVEIPVQEARAASSTHPSNTRGIRLSLTTPLPSHEVDTQSWGVPQTPPSTKSLHTDSTTTSPSKYSPTSQVSPSSASTRTMPTMSSLDRPSLPSFDRNTFPPTPSSVSNRVTQWIFPNDKSTKISPPEDNFNWERSRTLSGTTAASTSTVTGPRTRNNSSISSVFSSAITPRTSFSFHPSSPEKDLDPGPGRCQPTIFEGEQQNHPLYGYEGNETTRFRESGIGLAF
ncbi:unnamed protein product [Penicillium salamii]|uniref:Uncharacterized protein n=1 Tax=Penicillium salamii TaxID=1612424 RepID=A0A9W4NM64_9EURO|nr:unnamed protein product [Penicillium salamii]CAG7974000.1 unnamed protein product [Penicillium salamii]CAG8031145.1 unnamed protein product [Penicillium salamii]CAG8060700.1 unnamed protein product [Penicillium salamii]CAG8146580.1 unnamed protein product [Penicillium salamii]